MASIEFLQKRVTGKQVEIEKLVKKLERIQKAKDSNWEKNPYYYSESDLVSTEREIQKAEVALNNYREDLAKEQEKANSRNIQVIIDFLADWKKRVENYYIESLSRFLNARAEYYQHDSEYCTWFNTNRDARFSDEDKKRKQELREHERAYKSTWSFLMPYITYQNELDIAKLQKDLNREADCKYDDIIERTNDIVGQITDASDLKIGYKGDLNGIIKGTRGSAKVETIGAGGYNIQCYHFRTLIHAIK